MPDMTRDQITQAHKQLDGSYEKIVIMNVSDACLVLPMRILKRAGSGDRCFWERT
jgi:hypothetical protein